MYFFFLLLFTVGWSHKVCWWFSNLPQNICVILSCYLISYLILNRLLFLKLVSFVPLKKKRSFSIQSSSATGFMSTEALRTWFSLTLDSKGENVFFEKLRFLATGGVQFSCYGRFTPITTVTGWFPLSLGWFSGGSLGECHMQLMSSHQSSSSWLMGQAPALQLQSPSRLCVHPHPDFLQDGAELLSWAGPERHTAYRTF